MSDRTGPSDEADGVNDEGDERRPEDSPDDNGDGPDDYGDGPDGNEDGPEDNEHSVADVDDAIDPDDGIDLDDVIDVDDENRLAEDDPIPELDAPDGDLAELFTEVEADDVDPQAVWAELDASVPAGDVDGFEGGARVEEPIDEAVLGGGTDDEATVPKASYCQRCEHFSRPPDVGCSNPGTEIVELVDVKHFRVRNCPVVARRRGATVSSLERDDGYGSGGGDDGTEDDGTEENGPPESERDPGPEPDGDDDHRGGRGGPRGDGTGEHAGDRKEDDDREYREDREDRSGSVDGGDDVGADRDGDATR